METSRQPWSAYAVFLTTLSPPALVGDLGLVAFCWKGTESWDEGSRTLALKALLVWMFISKFIKLVGHYIRYPSDVILLPVSILFGYFHGLIKLYAACTLSVVCPEPVSLYHLLSKSLHHHSIRQVVSAPSPLVLNGAWF